MISRFHMVVIAAALILAYIIWGGIMDERAKRACKALGYPNGGTDGPKAWTQVCLGERGTPPPVLRRTPLDEARKGVPR